MYLNEYLQLQSIVKQNKVDNQFKSPKMELQILDERSCSQINHVHSNNKDACDFSYLADKQFKLGQQKLKSYNKLFLSESQIEHFNDINSKIEEKKNEIQIYQQQQGKYAFLENSKYENRLQLFIESNEKNMELTIKGISTDLLQKMVNKFNMMSS